VLAHLVLLAILEAGHAFDAFKPQLGQAQSVSPVALRALPQTAWSKNRRVDPNPNAAGVPPAPQAAEKRKEPEPTPKGRVVDVAPGNGVKPDDDARFLAEHNNRVDKESMSRDRTLAYKNAMPRPSTTLRPSEQRGGHDEVEKDVIAGNGGEGADDGAPKSGQKKGLFELPSIQKRDRLALKLDGESGEHRNQVESEEVRGNSPRLRIQSGAPSGDEAMSSAGRAGALALRTLTPSSAALDKIAGAPASDLTPLDDVEEGAATYLNTREWKYSSFFNRIKQTVGMHWDPNSVVRQRDPTGEIYLYKDRHTILTVVLDDKGGLKNVAVDKSSGVDFLDREAIAAFRRSQPFPNPPPGLQNSDGEIRFGFGFYLETNHAGLRLFRSNN
jgi:TonB family protein